MKPVIPNHHKLKCYLKGLQAPEDLGLQPVKVIRSEGYSVVLPVLYRDLLDLILNSNCVKAIRQTLD